MYPSNYFFVSVPKQQISRLRFLNQFRNSVWYICFEKNKEIFLHYIRRVVLVPLSKKYTNPPLRQIICPLCSISTQKLAARSSRGWQWEATVRGRAADTSARAARSPAVAPAGRSPAAPAGLAAGGAAAWGWAADALARGGSGVALLGSCLGRDADVLARAVRSLAAAPAGGGSGAGSGR